MTYALIDNASLTAVQRVLGEAEARNPDIVNGDLAAFENVIQAILFYDELICIDDYKAEYKEPRKERFNFVRFLGSNDFDLTSISKQANREASKFRPEIRGGVFVDADFANFIQLLKMNIYCTWDLRSSVYYLTMKMLGQPNTEEFGKYTQLSASIFSELSDTGTTKGRWSDEILLVSSKGHIHTKEEMTRADQQRAGGLGGLTPALSAFVASLNWLSYKSIYYSLAARYFKADTVLHPIRHGFQLHWMRKAGVYNINVNNRLIDALSTSIRETLGGISEGGSSVIHAIELPIFSASLANRTGDVSQVIPAALALKKEESIAEIRETLREVRKAFDEGGFVKANPKIEKWKASLHKASQAAKKKFGLKTDQGIPAAPFIKIYNSIASAAQLPSFPELDFKIPLPDFIQKNESTSFAQLYRALTNDLLNVERLGSTRDLLAARFRFEEGWKFHYKAPPVELPKFKGKESDWKQPM